MCAVCLASVQLCSETGGISSFIPWPVLDFHNQIEEFQGHVSMMIGTMCSDLPLNNIPKLLDLLSYHLLCFQKASDSGQSGAVLKRKPWSSIICLPHLAHA